MRTGIVFDIKGNKATIMLTGGTFITISKKLDWKKGDVVTIETKNNLTFPSIAVSACLFFIISLSTLLYSIYYKQTSLISLDVNPSIEIGLNKFNRIISLKAYNNDGEIIKNSLNLKNKTYEEALSTIFSSDVFKPYLNGGLTFAIQSANKSSEDVMVKNIQDILNTFVSASDPKISYFKVDENIVTEAHSHHVTPGKYMFLLKLKEVAPEINIEDFINSSIKDIETTIETHHSENNGEEHSGESHDECSGHECDHEEHESSNTDSSVNSVNENSQDSHGDEGHHEINESHEH